MTKPDVREVLERARNLAKSMKTREWFSNKSERLTTIDSITAHIADIDTLLGAPITPEMEDLVAAWNQINADAARIQELEALVESAFYEGRARLTPNPCPFLC